jgi:hypothetical protein
MLPFGTLFTSQAWIDQPEGQDDLGEVPGADREYSMGLPPYPVDATQGPCGTADQFANGDVLATRGPANLNIYGGVSCCPLPPEPFLHNECPVCVGGSWSTYTAIVSGLGPLPLAAEMNGEFSLQYRGNCLWTSDPVPWAANPGHTWYYAMGPGFNQLGCLLHVDGGFGEVSWNQDPNVWDCNSLVRVPFIGPSRPPFTGTPQLVLLPGIASGAGVFCANFAEFLPPDLSVRVANPGVGVIDRIRAGDYPLALARPCVWRGVLWFTFRAVPLPIRFPVGITCELRALPDGSFELAGQSPHGAQFFYSSDPVAPWDLSPLALMLDPPAPILLGLPQSVMLFAQSNLPP